MHTENIIGNAGLKTARGMNRRLGVPLCILLLCSAVQPLLSAGASSPPPATLSLAERISSGVEEEEPLVDNTLMGSEAALDDHLELQELPDREKHFLAVIQLIMRTLAEVENTLVENEEHPSSDFLENLIDAAETRTENLENKFRDLVYSSRRWTNCPCCSSKTV
jgi:hypothetical protein